MRIGLMLPAGPGHRQTGAAIAAPIQRPEDYSMPDSIPNASDKDAAREKAYATPLKDFDVGNPELFRSNTFCPYFERLRHEDPAHSCPDSMFGPYWSVTK